MATNMLDLRGAYKKQYGFRTQAKPFYESQQSLSGAVVKEISGIKGEPAWISEFRQKALGYFSKMAVPKWGADLSGIDFDEFTYYVRPTEKQVKSWDELPADIKNTFDKLGIPEAERKFLSGVGAQFESENVYHNLLESLAKQGVVFVDPDTGLNPTAERIKQMELDPVAIANAHARFKEWFGRVVPIGDNKFAALNSAVFSGGSFIYIPPGVSVSLPLQAYFRINRESVGQFERTLIIADKGSKVHYIEGCFTKDAPIKTISGTKKIEDIKEGDVVLTHTGSYKKVYKTQKRKHSGTLCKIKYNGDSRHEMEITGGHPVLAVKRARKDYKNKKWAPEWIEAANLEPGDYLAVPIDRTVISKDERFFSVQIGRGRHPFKAIEFKIATDKDFFRLVGYYMAEGSVMGGHYLTFTFNKREREYIEDVKALLEKFFGKAPLEYEEYKSGISLVLCSTLAARLFRQEFNSGAKNKSLPRWFMLEAPEKQSEFIKGYWRGDGSFMNKKYPGGRKILFRINTISEKLAEQTRNILLRLNVFASINVWKKKAPRSDSFAVYIGGSYLKEFARIVGYVLEGLSAGGISGYDLLTEQRFVSYAHVAENYAFTPVKSITKDEVKNLEVFNFSVEEDESYISHEVAVHNCSAPMYSDEKSALHTAVVEIVALPGSTVRYTTLQNWSNNVYNLVTKRAYAYENATVEWVDANIGCLAGSTKIFLNSDVKEIKDMEVGDVVFAMDESMKLVRRQVLGRKYSGRQKVYRLVSENHREIVATANHPFLTLTKSGTRMAIRWKRLDEVTEKDMVALAGSIPDYGKPMKINYSKKTGTKDIAYPKTTTEDLMWLLGFYLGDGYVNGSRVYFAVPEKDRSYEKVIKTVKGAFNLEKFEKRRNVIRYSSVDFVRFLEHLGLRGSAREKRVPQWVFTLPREQRLAFISGYIDADGHIRKGHKNVSLTSVNRRLLEDVKTLAISCGLDARKITKWTRRERKPLGKEEKEYTHYFLYFGEKNLEQPVCFSRILSVTECGEEDTYDIEIEGAHNFVANGFIVHNSKVTMKYPSVHMLGAGAKADILSVAYAGKGQHQDSGGKAVHMAPNTTSKIISKSVSKDGGRSTYRGLLHIAKGALNAKSTVRCDALLLDGASRTDTYPYNEIKEESATVTHEASVGKIGEELIFYLMSRGLSEGEALSMVVNGFLEVFSKELPMEYAVEFNRLIQLEMAGSVG